MSNCQSTYLYFLVTCKNSFDLFVTCFEKNNSSLLLANKCTMNLTNLCVIQLLNKNVDKNVYAKTL